MSHILINEIFSYFVDGNSPATYVGRRMNQNIDILTHDRFFGNTGSYRNDKADSIYIFKGGTLVFLFFSVFENKKQILYFFSFALLNLFYGAHVFLSCQNWNSFETLNWAFWRLSKLDISVSRKMTLKPFSHFFIKFFVNFPLPIYLTHFIYMTLSH